MSLIFTTTKKQARINGVKIVVYGKAGVGKTKLCSTAPKPIILTCEGGLLSLREFDIPVIPIRSYGDIIEAFNFVSKSAKAKVFETVCLDSITEIAEVVLTDAKTRFKDKRQAYGELIDSVVPLIKQFRDLPGKNVYFSAQEVSTVDRQDSSVYFSPNMPGGKLENKLQFLFDGVFRMEADNDGKRFLRTQANFQCIAKDRSGALNKKESPNLTRIINKIMRSVKE